MAAHLRFVQPKPLANLFTRQPVFVPQYQAGTMDGLERGMLKQRLVNRRPLEGRRVICGGVRKTALVLLPPPIVNRAIADHGNQPPRQPVSIDALELPME